VCIRQKTPGINSTLKVSSEIKALARFIAKIDTSNSSLTFFSPKTIKGVITMVIPSPLKRSGIQKVNVFPEPVGASVSKSLPLNCVNAASSCQVQGLQPKRAFTASHISSRDGRASLGSDKAIVQQGAPSSSGLQVYARIHALIHTYSTVDINQFDFPNADTRVYD
jgi:hypothetical protein